MTAAPLISMFSTALVPCASGSVFGDEPGCVYPSTVTASVAFGSHVVSTIVCTPAPGMVNAIVSAPGLDSESVEDRLAERARAGVARVRHGEGRGGERRREGRRQQQREGQGGVRVGDSSVQGRRRVLPGAVD